MSKELAQFNVYDVFEPLYADKLSDEDKSKDGKIKARSCSNVSVQREHVAKEEAAAPTVALEYVFVTATIDAKGKREV